VPPRRAHLKPGNILERTRWTAWNAIKRAGDRCAGQRRQSANGPIFIEGASPGDTLVVHILDLQVDGNRESARLRPDSARSIKQLHPMLHAPLPEKIWFYTSITRATPPRSGARFALQGMKIPLHPFLAASELRHRAAKSRRFHRARGFGGNMDARKLAGNTLYLR